MWSMSVLSMIYETDTLISIFVFCINRMRSLSKIKRSQTKLKTCKITAEHNCQRKRDLGAIKTVELL